MDWISQTFLFLLIISGFVGLLTAYVLFKRKSAPGAFYFAALMISIVIWIIGNIIEYYAADIDQKYFGLQIQYFFGIPFSPVLWFIAALNYTTLGRRPKKFQLIALLIIPILTMVLMITTKIHHIYYYNFRVHNYGSFSLLYKDWGIWFYVHITYSYFTLAAGTVLLLFSLRRSKQIYKLQTASFLLGLSLPWIANFLYVAGMKSFMPVDFTPVVFPFSVVMLGWAIYQYGLFDIIPAARSAVIESMKPGLLVVDNQNRIVDINPSAQKIFRDKKIIGKSAIEILDEIRIDVDDVYKTSEHHKEMEIDDQIYDLSVSEVIDKWGESVGKTLTFHNVTERKKTEKELSELNAAKDKFFSIIAHDLKNPFFGIRGMAQLLLDDFDSLSYEERRELITEIRGVSENTYRMLENLLDWAQDQTGRMVFHPTNFSLRQIVQQLVDILEKNADLKKIKIQIEIDDDAKVLADEAMITTVIRNLISNAIKFTNKGGIVKVAAKKLKDRVYISVEDTGIGIDKITLEKLFRIDATIKSKGTAGEKGTGLGLILCREFVEKHGETISVKSALGSGSSFSFSLPVSIKNN